MGFIVVLANKVPLAGEQFSVDRLHRIAMAVAQIHEATVGAGLPVIDTLQKLLEAGDDVLWIEGCPSGTLGYVFGELGRGERFSVALQRAVALGYAEPDPRIDLSGLDVARKALILARAIGFRGESPTSASSRSCHSSSLKARRSPFSRRIHAIDESWARRANDARRDGKVLRYRAHVTPETILVGLAAVSTTDPLGNLHGTDNQFTFTTLRYRERRLVITGPGAGPAVTAAGVFNDLLRLERTRARHRAPVSPRVAAQT